METKTAPNLLRQVGTSGEWFAIGGRSLASPNPGSLTTHVTRADLQSIVQAAYDQLGILAQPWIAAEAEPIERPANLPGDSNGHLRRMLETGA